MNNITPKFNMHAFRRLFAKKAAQTMKDIQCRQIQELQKMNNHAQKIDQNMREVDKTLSYICYVIILAGINIRIGH